MAESGHTLWTMRRRSLVFVVIAALACAAAPDAARVPEIAPGVTVGGLPLAGLTSEVARTALTDSQARPIRIVRGNVSWWAWPDTLRVQTPVGATLARALAAQPGATVPLHARWSDAAVDRLVRQIGDGVDRAPLDSALVGIVKGKPVFTDARAGLSVRRDALRRDLRRELANGTREAIRLPVRTVPAQRTRAHFGGAIWIDRGTNTLRLFDGTKLVRTFRVATGQSAYPTPSGVWEIVDKQMNPWWRPPDSPWAAGAKPIPPGPGNPLGTRWMGLNAAGVGIHGTPDAASIGYSASHGCIRMQIPEAEWLFNHVDLGTPVAIT
jgi:lipoprotein-anchoring transpeptidase ErfK/SrfK